VKSINVCKVRYFTAFLKEEVQVYINRTDVQEWLHIDVNLYSPKRIPAAFCHSTHQSHYPAITFSGLTLFFCRSVTVILRLNVSSGIKESSVDDQKEYVPSL
jgi:hypothetical protein